MYLIKPDKHSPVIKVSKNIALWFLYHKGTTPLYADKNWYYMSDTKENREVLKHAPFYIQAEITFLKITNWIMELLKKGGKMSE